MFKCTGCGLDKDDAEFTKRTNKLGARFYYRCVGCRKGIRHTSYVNNKETERENNKVWLEAHPEKVKEYSKRHKNKNPKKKDQDRKAKLKRVYGITQEEFEMLWAAQENKCAICLVEFSSQPHIDHCHKRKRVRGLLCGKCNRALGMLNDSPALFRQAAVYLEKTCVS